VEAPWFADWLHDKGELPLKEALLFPDREQTYGRVSMPGLPANAQTKSLYFGADGKLSLRRRKRTPPKHLILTSAIRQTPCPTATGLSTKRIPPIIPAGWYTWLVQDQRFVEKRPDVLSWKTDVLQEDVTRTGQVTAKLFAATTGSDADWCW